MKHIQSHWFSFLLIAVLVLLIFIIYRGLLLSTVMTGGDLSYAYQEMLSNYTVYPYAWDWYTIGGLGAYSAPLLFAHFSVIGIPILDQFFHQSQASIYRMLYVIPFFCISLLSIFFFLNFFIKRQLMKSFFFASIIFIFNTYILMVIGGGNFLIPLAYAMTPLIIAGFCYSWGYTAKNAVKFFPFPSFFGLSIPLGLAFSLQLMFDARIFYITLFAMIIFILLDGINMVFVQKITLQLAVTVLVQFLYTLFLPFSIVFLLNFYWILPSLIVHINPLAQLGSAYTSDQAVHFFSFADFSHAISLLHPNWPENIFGKVYFMQPEFLLIPIFAFSSLFFISQKKKLDNGNNKSSTQRNSAVGKNNREYFYLLYFSILGLLGAFLAKGTNDPFGNIYVWMFDHVPGFGMFRDATKWYTLIALSYSFLIPFSLLEIITRMQMRVKFSVRTPRVLQRLKSIIINIIVFSLFVSYFLFTIRPAISGKLHGTFASHTIPVEYVNLKNFISSQPDYFRTLWFPATERFGFFTSLHPQVSAKDFFKKYDTVSLLKILGQKNTQQLVEDSAIKYIVIPFDAEHEIFLKNGTYDDKQYGQVVRGLEFIPWLIHDHTFGKIGIFRVKAYKPHFFITNRSTTHIREKMLHPVYYQADIQNAGAGDTLVFSEAYDPHWQLFTGKRVVMSKPYHKLFNSFVLPESGNYNLSVSYSVQNWINRGMMVSIITAICILLLILFYVLRKLLFR